MNSENKKETAPTAKPKKPDETGGIQVDEFIKISDPDSGKVYVAKRGNS